jgi:hypothetical protein
VTDQAPGFEMESVPFKVRLGVQIIVAKLFQVKVSAGHKLQNIAS